MWVVDADHDERVIVASRVSHALKSGLLVPHQFSNEPGSNLSSPGSYVTGQTYEGDYGYSLRLYGLDVGVNDNAYRRFIVVHPDQRMSHSLGCFMLPMEMSRAVIDAIKDGTFFYVHAR